MEVMYHRKNGKRYEVYHYITDGNHVVAVCFDTDQAGRCNGAGWCRMRLKDLVPEAHANTLTGEFQSNTERAKIKHQLKLVDAIWECTDGCRYEHSAIEEAMEHQKMLMEMNKNASNNNCT